MGVDGDGYIIRGIRLPIKTAASLLGINTNYDLVEEIGDKLSNSGLAVESTAFFCQGSYQEDTNIKDVIIGKKLLDFRDGVCVKVPKLSDVLIVGSLRKTLGEKCAFHELDTFVGMIFI